MQISELKCGSGGAWVDDKVRHFRDFRQVTKGKCKGHYEIWVIKGLRFYRKKWRPKFTKVTVPPDAIKYLPRPGRKRRS